MRTAMLLLFAVLALASCGKRGSPQAAGPADQITFPRSYPSR